MRLAPGQAVREWLAEPETAEAFGGSGRTWPSLILGGGGQAKRDRFDGERASTLRTRRRARHATYAQTSENRSRRWLNGGMLPLPSSRPANQDRRADFRWNMARRRQG